MNYLVGKVVGINTDQQASLSISNGQEDNLFLGILKLECDDAFTRGRTLLSDLADEFLDSSESHSARLTKAAEEVKQKLADTVSFSFLLAGFSGKALYLIGKDQVAAHLYRAGSAQTLPLT